MRALIDRVLRAREGSQNPWLLVVAFSAFVAFTVLAVRSLPHIDKPVWDLIVVSLIVFSVLAGIVPFATRRQRREQALATSESD
jgi:hypothetical protein